MRYVLTALASLGLASFAHAATLTVSSTADNTTAGDGFCTLREAVQEATLLAGAGPFECGGPTLGGSDTIVMNAAVAGQTINLVSALTFNNDGAIIIQGSDIVIDGTGLGLVMIVISDKNELRDLKLQNGGTAIEVRSTADATIIGGATNAERVEIDDFTNYGVRIRAATNTTIRRTRIADSNRNVQIDDGSAGVTIKNTTLGLDPNGAASGSNLEVGVWIDGGSSITIRDGHLGDNAFGVMIFGGDGITIRGNFIGTNLAGTVARSNSTAIFVGGDATNVIIGDASAAGGNLISSNQLQIGVVNVDGVQILNNIIGTNAAGTAVLPGLDGIILNGALDTVLTGNVIAGHGLSALGVDSTSSAVLTRNLIGTNAALANFPNSTNVAVAAVIIDGPATLVGNTIAFHDTFAGSAGIYVGAGGSIASGSLLNCISGNDVGLVDDTSGDINFAFNYWGDPDGPTILPGGAVEGDSIDESDTSGVLDYLPFLASNGAIPCP